MHEAEILNFIEQKKKYIENGYKLHFIFEVFYSNDLPFDKNKFYEFERKLDDPVNFATPYKMKRFLTRTSKNYFKGSHVIGVKLIHNASLDGLSCAEIAFVDKASSDESKEEKCDDFFMAFEKIIDNIAPKSLIILSKDQHHLEKLKRKAEQSFSISEKRRKAAAGSSGQKTITEYFKSTKSAPATRKKSDDQQPIYKIEEEIINKKGSDSDIKILWIPKGNEELNPANYVAIMFYNELMDLMEEEMDLMEAFKHTLNILPNELWKRILTYIEHLEDMYVTESKVKENNLKDANEDKDD